MCSCWPNLTPNLLQLLCTVCPGSGHLFRCDIVDRSSMVKITVVLCVGAGTGWANPSRPLSLFPFIKIVASLLKTVNFPSACQGWSCFFFPALPRLYLTPPSSLLTRTPLLQRLRHVPVQAITPPSPVATGHLGIRDYFLPLAAPPSPD
jgi:hypothetical protein